jgi:hypothetical protein
VTGFEADQDAIAASARLLSSTVDSLESVVDGLGPVGGLGPGRLDEVSAALVDDLRQELTGLLDVLGADAASVESMGGGYAARDQEAADHLRDVR